jgi:hypothetical protein
MSFTPTANTTFVGLQKQITLSQLNTLATAGQLDLNTTYIDTATGYKYWARDANNYSSAGLNFDVSSLNYVESGLLLPASGTIAAATLSSGVAYVEANRVARAATALTLTATRDNYVDLRRDGTVTVTAVTVGAAAPAIPVNSMRLGFCTTNASNVTSRTIAAFDSLGNWMYNVSSQPFCRLRTSTTQGTGGVLTAVNFSEADLADNATMHDPALNATRITFPFSGLYQVSCTVAFTASFTNTAATMALYARLDGATVDDAFPQGIIAQNVASNGVGTTGIVSVRAGQYLEMLFAPNGVSGLALAAAWLTCAKIS